MSAATRYILPSNVKPVHYVLRVEPDLDNETFKGNVKIDVEISSGNTIALNAVDQELSNVYLLQGASETKNVPTKITEDKENQVWTFEFAKLEPGVATLSIDFKSEFNKHIVGFYLSKYEVDGVKKKMALTNAEPADNRRSFPCFDEPALKATFDIIIVHNKDLVAISNMDVKEESLEAEKKVTKFNTTPKISTYLVAYSIGDLDYVEYNELRVPSRVYFPTGSVQKSQVQYAVKFAARVIDFFEKKFDLDYPLPKIDNLVCHDFSAGAMENWGLVIYRLSLLVYTPGKDSPDTLRLVTEVIAHELAHQWFGNIVTMEWWDNLWLNEGFATWASLYCCDALLPELKIWDRSVTEQLAPCMNLDSLRSSHPIEVPIFKVAEVGEVFDNISYLKGSSVIRMIADYLGEDVFIKGISNYLKKHKFSNATTADLWASLSEVSGKDVAKTMATWTSKVGFPVITVTDKPNGVIGLKQNRFLASGDVTAEEDTAIYPSYLGIKTKDGVHKVMLDKREMDVSLDTDFYLVNAQYASIARILYPIDRTVKLAEAGTQGLLSVSEKVGLINDSAQLARSGNSSTTSFLELISKWREDKNSAVWKEIYSSVAYIFSAVKGTEAEKPLVSFIADTVSPLAKSLGFKFSESDDLETTELKTYVFQVAVSFGHKEAVESALSFYDDFVKNGTEIYASIQPSVFEAVSRYGTPEQWNALFELYKKNDSTMMGTHLLKSLGATPHKECADKLLTRSLTSDIILQNGHFVTLGFNWSPYKALPFEFVKANFAVLKQRFDGLGLIQGYAVWRPVSYLNTAEEVDDLVKFVSTVDISGIEKTYKETIDGLKSKVAYQARDVKSITKWLKSKGY